LLVHGRRYDEHVCCGDVVWGVCRGGRRAPDGEAEGCGEAERGRERVVEVAVLRPQWAPYGRNGGYRCRTRQVKGMVVFAGLETCRIWLL